MIEINIYQSKALTERNNRTPERVVERYLRGALDDFTLSVQRRFDTLIPPDEEAHCSGEALNWFEPQYLATDANILLLDDSGGGCAYINGNTCTAPARHINRDISYQFTGEGDIHRNIHAVLHEVAHNLGLQHDLDPEKTGKQHAGVAWNAINTFWGIRLPWGGRWHRTPCVVANDVTNACGKYIPNREYGKVVYHQYYSNCAKANIDSHTF